MCPLLWIFLEDSHQLLASWYDSFLRLVRLQQAHQARYLHRLVFTIRTRNMTFPGLIDMKHWYRQLPEIKGHHHWGYSRHSCHNQTSTFITPRYTRFSESFPNSQTGDREHIQTRHTLINYRDTSINSNGNFDDLRCGNHTHLFGHVVPAFLLVFKTLSTKNPAN